MSRNPFRAFLRISALGVAFVAADSLAAEPKIPQTFLPAQGKLREGLQTPVSGTFQATPAHEVIAALCRQLPANNVYKRDISKPAATFTGTFKDTPLRTALFRVAQATHITVEWAERPDGSKLISVRE